jgi:hypothetical protein
MKSKVYFTRVRDAGDVTDLTGKLKKLLASSGVLDVVQKNDQTAVKVHFGEKGNTGFVDPRCLRVVCDAIAARGASAFVSDTNTLYLGRRTNSKDHLELAREHGFSRQTLGVDVIIPDDKQADAAVEVPSKGKYVKTAKLARLFVDASAMVAVSHFKGHILTSFGGAIKNLSMGCATRAGKLAQHNDVSPVVYQDRCIGCGECVAVCPTGAITLKDKKSVIDMAKCIGCANCVGVCPTMAVFVDFKAGSLVQKKMAEYAEAVLRGKRQKAAFINFAVKINKECDCWGPDNPRIGPDVGILASLDPVAIDKASLDLVAEACRKDIFKEAHPDQDGLIQLRYAEAIGLGNLEYERIEI